MDLTEHGGRAGFDIAQGKSHGRLRELPWTRYRAEISFVPQVDGLRVVPLRLHPLSEVTAVKSAEGRQLHFFRNHLGRRICCEHMGNCWTDQILVRDIFSYDSKPVVGNSEI